MPIIANLRLDIASELAARVFSSGGDIVSSANRSFRLRIRAHFLSAYESAVAFLGDGEFFGTGNAICLCGDRNAKHCDAKQPFLISHIFPFVVSS